MRTIDTDTLIIGAGPAGMACAIALAKEGRRFIIVEAQGQVGGLAKTMVFEEDGLVFRTDQGPHRFFSKNHALYDFIETLLQDRWMTVQRSTRQYIDGKFYDYPVHFFQALRNVGMMRALRMGVDYFLAKIQYGWRGKPIENFADYIYAHFGKTLGEFNMINYTEKIWGIPASTIHKDWAGQRIRGLNVRTLLKDALARLMGKKQKDGVKTLVDTFYYPELGTGLIYETIEQRLRARGYEIFLNAFPRAIRHEDARIKEAVIKQGEEEFVVRFNELVESIPLPRFFHLLDPPPPLPLLTHAGHLRHRSQVYVFLTLDKDSVTNDQWIYFPNKGIPIGRISEMKNFSAKMAPPGKTSLFIEYFCFEGDARWKMADAALFEETVAWLARLHFIARADVRHYYVMRQKDVYPLYDVAYEHHLKPLKEFLNSFPNLYYIGRPGRFHYNNQDHSLEMGFAAARSILLGYREDFDAIGEEKEYYEKGSLRKERKDVDK